MVERTPELKVQGLNALTLATHDMRRSVDFYRSLGFELHYGSETTGFTSFLCGTAFLNLILMPESVPWSWWGRAIFHVNDVDAFYARARAHGYAVAAPPRDAEWGERYFHLTDPDGHELSFARPLSAGSTPTQHA
jgi:catechol 2,3-dioxygenase-like lactoylglutathione lyase family enzyme